MCDTEGTPGMDAKAVESGLTRLAEKVYHAPWAELNETKRDRIRRIYEDYPEGMKDLLEGDHYSRADIADGLDGAFSEMQERDFSDEKLDGAAILLKALRVRFGIEDYERGSE